MLSKTIFLTVFVSCSCIFLCESHSLQLGTSVNNELAYIDHVKLAAVPFTTRTKNVFYSDDNNRVIKGIAVVEQKQSEAQVSVTAGGVGTAFVNIRLKSERGGPIDHMVQIFV